MRALLYRGFTVYHAAFPVDGVVANLGKTTRAAVDAEVNVGKMLVVCDFRTHLVEQCRRRKRNILYSKAAHWQKTKSMVSYLHHPQTSCIKIGHLFHIWTPILIQECTEMGVLSYHKTTNEQLQYVQQ